MHNKIKSLNDELVKTNQKDHSLNPGELETLDDVMEGLSASGATSKIVVGGMQISLPYSP
jgi:hypothetical protein